MIRTVVPFVWQDDFAPGAGSTSGLGDITQSFFLSPQAVTPGGVTSGVGPVLLYPTATHDALGREKWGADLTGVVLRQTGGWTYSCQSTLTRAMRR